MTCLRKKSTQALGIIQHFVGSLSRHDLLYCHWKSNEHLLPAVLGDTDLDILFDESGKQAVENILTANGFVRFKPKWYLGYPYIEDYLGIDSDTGKLVHVHAHFRLVLGEKRIKGYRFPWERQVLEARVWDEECGIYRSDPGHELLLLLIRQALKMPLGFPGKPSRAFKSDKEADDAKREFLWLKDRVRLGQIQELGRSLLNNTCHNSLAGLYQNGLDRKGLQALLDDVKPILDRYRRFGKTNLLMVRLPRDTAYIFARLIRKAGIVDIPVRRTAMNQGLIISLLGADGSGKSTQKKRAQKILSEKLDVLPIYMGSGNGPVSLIRLPLVLVKRIVKIFFSAAKQPKQKDSNNSSAHGENIQTRQGHQQGSGKDLAVRFWRICWAVSLALEKKHKLKRAVKAKSRGMIVICDRYPQTTIFGYNDGPLLQDYAKGSSKIMRWLASWELRQFSHIQQAPPDLAVKLLGDPGILHSRRPEMTRDKIIEKQEGIRTVRFPDHTQVQEIDAALSPEQVTTQIMNAVSRLFTCLGGSTDDSQCG